MRRALETAVRRLRPVADGVTQLVLVLRARGHLRRALTLALAACVIAAAAGVYWLSPADERSHGQQTGEDAWRYLVVCNECKCRERFQEHPARTLPKRDGLLRCPKCRRFSAAWYRRGSQAVPPGGW